MGVVVALGSWPGYQALADAPSTSSSYMINETELGGSGGLGGASTNYTFTPGGGDGGSTLGDTFAGNGSSANYQTNGGFNTTQAPVLTEVVNTSLADLGILSTGAAKTATATFSVKDYTSYGYVVTIVGTPPTYSGHQLAPMTTTSYGDASVAGSEQFGLNLVHNTSPSTVGTDPVQVPSSVFSFGVAGDGATGTYGTNRPYTVDGRFRFVSGETVASGPKSSGETDYTVTFIGNASNTSPAGVYSGNLAIVATGTY